MPVNLCKFGDQDDFKFTEHQKRVANKMTPQRRDGLLLWWNTGAGKTAALLLIASTFEKHGWTVVWVTRRSLVQNVQKEIEKLNTKVKVKPFIVSYKQFSNLNLRIGDLYRNLLNKQHPSSDLLWRTLVIIDESHKLFDKDLKAQEQHNPESIVKLIKKSYTQNQRNKQDSVRVVLASATPMSGSPQVFLAQLALLTPDYVSMNIRDYLASDGSLKAKTEFLHLIDYVDISSNASYFAQLKEHVVFIQASGIAIDGPKTIKECLPFDCDAHTDKIQQELCEAVVAECKVRVKANQDAFKESQVDTIRKNCGIKI